MSAPNDLNVAKKIQKNRKLKKKLFKETQKRNVFISENIKRGSVVFL